MWHFSAAWLHFLAEADTILVPSASPGRGVRAGGEEGLHSARIWNRLQDALALLFQTWIVYVNRVGSEDGLIFSGGSRVVDPFGEERVRLPLLETGTVELLLDSETLRRARVATPLRRDERPHLVASEITRICGLRAP
jgi:predicted amidohydrolase